MATVFVIFATLAFYHFIFESLIIPSYKMEVKYKIINLRSELIQFGISNKPMRKSVTRFANLMAYTINEFEHHNIIEFFLSRNRVKDSEPSIVEFNKDFDVLVKTNELNHIISSYNKCLKRMFILNMGAGFLYIIPIVLIIQSIKLLRFPIFRIKH